MLDETVGETMPVAPLRAGWRARTREALAERHGLVVMSAGRRARACREVVAGAAGRREVPEGWLETRVVAAAVVVVAVAAAAVVVAAAAAEVGW